MSGYTRHPVTLSGAAKLTVPKGQRTPFGWPVVAVTTTESPLLRAEPATTVAPGQGIWLRLSIALEVWQQAELEVSAPGLAAARITVDHCDVFEPLNVPLAPDLAEVAQSSGLSLRLSSGDGGVWLFDAGDAVPMEFRPHLVIGRPAPDRATARERFLDRMVGLGSIQQFGWKEGSVLDGLLDLAETGLSPSAAAAAQAHLNQFLDAEGRLRYEDPWSRPADDRVYGIEGALPFAAIERMRPGDRLVDRLTEYLAGARRDDGALFDEGMVSTEGAYTVAYPLTLLGTGRGRPELTDDALRQLRLRVAELTEGDILYLRAYTDGIKTYPNWIRAYTWYLLGLVRVLELAPRDATADLASEFQRAAGVALSHQGPNGLWSCFIDDPATGTETSGSAGIAAALARGARAGFLGDDAYYAALRARDALLDHLTVDGYLSGASQANKDGERLQRKRYRILSQMGMGLLAQLIAATSEPDLATALRNRKEP